MKKLDYIVDDTEQKVRRKLNSIEHSESIAVYTQLSNELLSMMIDTAVDTIFPSAQKSPGLHWVVKAVASSALSKEIKEDSSVVSAKSWLDDKLERVKEIPSYLGRDAWLSYRKKMLVEIAKDVYGHSPSTAEITSIRKSTNSSFEENMEHEEKIVAQVLGLANKKGLESALRPDVLAAQRRLHYGSREAYASYLTRIASQACSVLEPYINRETKKSRLSTRLTPAQSEAIASQLVQRFVSAFVDHTVSILYSSS